MPDISKVNINSTEYDIKDTTARSNITTQSSQIEQLTSNKEAVANKVTSISSSSTDTQYPSAKCVYDIVGNVEATLIAIRGVTP